MTLLEIRADVSRVASALERIAEALERVYPAPVEGPVRPMRFIHVDPSAIAEAEAEADRKREAGTEAAE